MSILIKIFFTQVLLILASLLGNVDYWEMPRWVEPFVSGLNWIGVQAILLVVTLIILVWVLL